MSLLNLNFEDDGVVEAGALAVELVLVALKLSLDLAYALFQAVTRELEGQLNSSEHSIRGLFVGELLLDHVVKGRNQQSVG